MKKITSLCVIFILGIVANVNAQGHSCMMLEIPMGEQVNQSTLIVEGEVLSKYSAWDNNLLNIYTVNEILVHKVFKGAQQGDVISVITRGGQVGDMISEVFPSLQLAVGQTGVFMLHSDDTNLGAMSPSIMQFKNYAGPQGFYLYDLSQNKAHGVFKHFDGITTSFYNTLVNLTGRNYTSFTNFNPGSYVVSPSTTGVENIMVINDIQPRNVNAGNEETITITGTGFGNVQGTSTILFRNADSGGANNIAVPSANFPQDLIVSWSNTQIVVKVPGRAGTGAVSIQTTLGLQTDNQGITVDWARLNVTTGGASPQTFVIRHFDQNANGGFVWRLSTNLSTNQALVTAFNKGFDYYRCTSGIFWEQGPVTGSTSQGGDGINIVKMSNPGELPAGVLGVTVNFLSICGTTANAVGFVPEVDMVFNNAVNWNFSANPPANNQIDFETVSTHELGHAHLLGHRIAPGQTMNFAVGPGQMARIPPQQEVNAINTVQADSESAPLAGCNSPAMDSFLSNPICSTLSTDDFALNSVSIFPNPSNGVLNLQANAIQFESLAIYDITGKLVKRLTLNNQMETQIHLTNIKPGVYMAQIQTDKGKVNRKLVIQ